jgi:hypothetical protein
MNQIKHENIRLFIPTIFIHTILLASSYLITCRHMFNSLKSDTLIILVSVSQKSRLELSWSFPQGLTQL